MSVTLQDSYDENEYHVDPLAPVELKRCGEIFFGLFTRFKNHGTANSNGCCYLSWSTSYYSIGEHILKQRFDGLYDLMSHDLENVDESYKTLPKNRLYMELADFVKYSGPLHDINRNVFGGDETRCLQDSKPNEISVLETVRMWRKGFDNTSVGVPDSLIGTYKTAADSGEQTAHDLAMIAFAVINFLSGYDTIADLNNAFIFDRISALRERPNFQQVYNRGSRNVRMFLHKKSPVNDWEYFEVLIANPLTVELLTWIFDLLVERPDAVKKFTSNPFSDEPDVSDEMCDVIGRKIDSSYVMVLRIFYRWVSRELFMLLSGEFNDRISLLDNHIKQNLSWNTSWTQLFDDSYYYVLEHFTKILKHYDCPAATLETFRVTWRHELFKELIKFCIHKLIVTNCFLGYLDNSTDSNESCEDLCSSSSSSSR